VLKGEKSNFYETDSAVSNVWGMSYSPIDGGTLLAGCSTWDVGCKMKKKTSTITVTAASTAYNLASTVYTGATETAKSNVAQISQTERDEYFEEWQGEQDSADTVDEIAGKAETDLGGLQAEVLDSNLSKLTNDPVGVAAFLPTYKVTTTTMLIAAVSLIALAIVAIYFGGTKRGRAQWQRIRASLPG